MSSDGRMAPGLPELSQDILGLSCDTWLKVHPVLSWAQLDLPQETGAARWLRPGLP